MENFNNPYNLEAYDENSERNELSPAQQEIYNKKMDQLKQDSLEAQEKYSLADFDENSLEQQIDKVQTQNHDPENPYGLKSWEEIQKQDSQKENNNPAKKFFSQVRKFFNF